MHASIIYITNKIYFRIKSAILIKNMTSYVEHPVVRVKIIILNGFSSFVFHMTLISFGKSC